MSTTTAPPTTNGQAEESRPHDRAGALQGPQADEASALAQGQQGEETERAMTRLIKQRVCEALAIVEDIEMRSSATISRILALKGILTDIDGDGVADCDRNGNPSDTTPAAFSFVDQTEVEAEAVITSAPVTLSGFNASSPITVSGGTYNINGGSFTSAAGTVVSGDVVRARHTASADGETAVNTVVTIGGVSDTFTSTTAAAGAPEWVPEAFAEGIWIEPRVIDGFATGRAWVAGTGVVAVDALLGADANTDNGWDTTTYDPANLTADGYDHSEEDGPAFIGAARTMLLAGATVQIEVRDWDTATDDVILAYLAASGNLGINVEGRRAALDDKLHTYSWDEVVTSTVNDVMQTGTNRVAATVSQTRLESSGNGSSPFAGVLTSTQWPTSGEDEIVAVILESDAPIYSIGIKPAIVGSAGLTALSTL
jgi:hypothetical protein